MGVSYEYDNLNRLTQIETEANSTVLSSHAYLYNLANQRTRATLVDGSYWEYSYDDLGQVTGGVKKESNGTVIPGYNFGYSFDDIGNRKTFSENAQVTSYTRNLLNQYSSINRPAVAFLRGDRANTNTTITVDLLGDGLGPQAATHTNLLWYYTQAITDLVSQFEVIATEGGNSNSSIGSLYTPNGSDSPQYDLDGNLTRDHLWNYTWDSENQLVAQEHRSDVTITPLARKRMEYTYDSQGRRVQRKTFQDNNGTWVLQEDIRFIWDQWNLLAEFDANNTVIRSYIWGLDLSGSMQGAGGVGGLLSVDNGTTVALPVFDGNGNVMGYTNSATGTLVAQYEYDPFGRRIKSLGAQAESFPHRFSTKYEDSETGFLYYGYRYFDPETGRWPNRDPIAEEGGYNLYGFVYNHPQSLFDDKGNSPIYAIIIPILLNLRGDSMMNVENPFQKIPQTFNLLGVKRSATGVFNAGIENTDILKFPKVAKWYQYEEVQIDDGKIRFVGDSLPKCYQMYEYDLGVIVTSHIFVFGKQYILQKIQVRATQSQMSKITSEASFLLSGLDLIPGVDNYTNVVEGAIFTYDAMRRLFGGDTHGITWQWYGDEIQDNDTSGKPFNYYTFSDDIDWNSKRPVEGALYDTSIRATHEMEMLNRKQRTEINAFLLPWREKNLTSARLYGNPF